MVSSNRNNHVSLSVDHSCFDNFKFSFNLKSEKIQMKYTCYTTHMPLLLTNVLNKNYQTKLFV